MLARSSSSTLSCSRGHFARCQTQLFILPSSRSESSLAAASKILSSSEQDASLPVKRSVPKASSFGDILIPTARNAARQSVRSSSNNEFKPDVSWLGDDEFDGATPFARRLARRNQAITKEGSSAQSVSEDALPPPRSANAHSPLPLTPRHGLTTQQRQHERGRQAEGRLPDRQAAANRQTVAERRKDDERRQANEGRRSGEVERGQRQRSDRNRPRERKHDIKGRGVQTQKVTGEQEKDETAITAEPLLQSAVPEMHIQTTDLDKLFGPAEATRASMRTVNIKGSSQPALAVARRVQYTLENTGGDYTRYLSPTLGTVFPEKLGPLGSAQLALARRRDAGLKMRHNGLGLIQSLVVQKVADTSSQHNSGLGAPA
ncbi:hypothetical protein AcW1_001059 [Taiwanofungus camphoratus]|nr:hypothetical protein AcW1_001059 [Antrodia cinnamomea]